MTFSNNVLLQALSENDLSTSIKSVREVLNEHIHAEHTLNCLMVAEKIHPLLLSVSEIHPSFKFQLSTIYETDYAYVAASIEISEKNSSMLEEINQELDILVSHSFSTSHIEQFQEKFLNLAFESNYSKEILIEKMIKNLVNPETYAIMSMFQLQSQLTEKIQPRNLNTKI